MEKATVILLILNIACLATAELRMPCTVVWKPILTGFPIPENAVSTHEDEHFVARYGGFAGRAVNSTGKAFIPTTEKTLYPLLYEILTNPYDCALTWVHTEVGGEIPEKQFAVGVGANKYVGKQGIQSASGSIQLAGSLINDFFYVVKPNGAWEKKAAGGVKFLRSTINLRCELSQFEFHDELEDGTSDFLGMDTIHNDSPVIVTQVVEHRKSITESYSLTESNTKSVVSSFSIGVSIPIGGAKISAGFGYDKFNTDTDSLTITHTEEKEVISKRTIIVPPYTSVQACSVLGVHDDDKGKPYTARGKYTIFGKSAAEVREILVTNGGVKSKDIIRHDGSAVLVNVNGTLVVSVPTRTKFIITPIDDPSGCTQLESKINKRGRAKMFGQVSRSELRNMDVDIKNMVNKL